MLKKYLLVFFVSMVPLIELRGAIPYSQLPGVSLPLLQAYIVAVIGNMVPVPFIYLFAKAFVDYAGSVGIDEKTAKELFAQSLVGSAKMITDSGYTIDELIKMVSSPGGTTLAGLQELYDGKMTETVIKACESCTRRAYELSK